MSVYVLLTQTPSGCSFCCQRGSSSSSSKLSVGNLFKHGELVGCSRASAPLHTSVPYQFQFGGAPVIHKMISFAWLQALILGLGLASVNISASFLASDFQTRSEAVTDILTDYLCDLQQTFADAQQQIQQRAVVRMALFDKLANSYAVDDRRVPWMLQLCRSLVDEHIMWMYGQQLAAWRHVRNETVSAQAQVRQHIGYYIHLDGLFPDAMADWSGAFERTAGELQAIGWKSNNDTASYHEESFGRILSLNRRILSEGSGSGNGTADARVGDDGGLHRSGYAGAWQTLVLHANSELRTTHDKFGALLGEYTSGVRAMGDVVARRLRKLNVIDEKCFCF